MFFAKSCKKYNFLLHIEAIPYREGRKFLPLKNAAVYNINKEVDKSFKTVAAREEREKQSAMPA